MPTKSEVQRAQVTTTPTALVEHLHRRLPEFLSTRPPERLRIGHFADAYRVHGEPEPLIVKLLAAPTADAHPGRFEQHPFTVEARSLVAFEPGGALERAATATVWPPRLIDFDQERHILVMEDVGDVPHLGDWLEEGGADREIPDLQHPGRLLGTFIAALHWESFADPGLAIDFDNSAIRGAWLELRYGAVGDALRRVGVPAADELGREAVERAEELQTPGICVTHGNLWPASVLITADGLRVIDWELTHYGHPAQDVGHLASHLWMHAHRAATSEGVERARATLRDFLTTYRLGLGSAFEEIFGAHAAQQSAVHFGVEILMRTVGAFREGYLYQDLAADAPAVQEAVEVAARHIRSPEQTDTFVPLFT